MTPGQGGTPTVSRTLAAPAPYPLTAESTVYVAGHRGMVGSAVCRALADSGRGRGVGHSSAELDLRRSEGVERTLRAVRPDALVDAAARVGGILANAEAPATFLEENLRIQLNLLGAARGAGVERLLFLGSSCIYPRDAAQPITEDALMTGPLEPTNEGYAVAKIAGMVHVQAVRRQYGLPWISAMPTNLYGPGDNFDPLSSHVLPAMIRRFAEARQRGAKHVVCWGSGRPRREFLHVDDLASACVHLLEHYDDPQPINVGTGVDVSIRELAELVAHVVGFDGDILWDETRPDGTPRKVLNVSRITDLGWAPTVSLEEGIRRTYEWFSAHQTEARGTGP